VLRRFASARTGGPWPFGEAWRVPFEGLLPRWCLRIERRVAVCVAIHRAIVAAIGTDVPTFVTGRDGDRPLGGAGHLAIHLLVDSGGSRPEAVLGLPTGVPEADRAALLSVLAARPKVRMGRQRVSLGAPRIGSALPFWLAETRQFATAVPMALDAPGAPRRGGWTLDDAVVCSVGYALRGVLEEGGMAWGTGWSFRQGLVAELRARGVGARARRVMAGASNFVHRARPGDLLVAADAVVDLGDLAPRGAGLLALGRARHLGGGLLRPLAEELP
jgi:CRISPR-associated protein Csb2